jgi:hypothetical protein
VGEYVVAFLLKNPVSKRNGVFCFMPVLKGFVLKVKDKVGVLVFAVAGNACI